MLAIFIDIESTGLDPYRHRVLEVAIKIVDLSTSATLGSYEAIVQQSDTVWEQSDPISLKVNGFTLEKMKKGRPEAAVTEEILAFFKEKKIARGEAVFIAQNSSFDRAFFAQLVAPYIQEELQWPYHWLDLASMYWCRSARQAASSKQISLSKNDIAERYGIPPEETPHRAINGVEHLIACYRAVVEEEPL